MNEIIKIVEWQLILFFIFAFLNVGFLVMFIVPRIEKWLIKFNKDLKKHIGG